MHPQSPSHIGCEGNYKAIKDLILSLTHLHSTREREERKARADLLCFWDWDRKQG